MGTNLRTDASITGESGERGMGADPNRLGRLIRRVRMERGLTLREAAAGAGCATSYLSAIETGHRASPAPELLERLEKVLGLPAGRLVGAGAWEAASPSLRREVAALHGRLHSRDRAAARLAAIVGGGSGASALDEAYRSGELRRLVEQIAPEGADEAGGDGPPAAGRSGVSLALESALPREVPLINRVAAGYPTEFTDLGYPARVADEYVRCPDLEDPDAFGARVVGESMLPDYREGDIVVFSPRREVKSGMECGITLERFSDVTAMGRTLPALTCGSVPGSDRNESWTRPEMTSGIIVDAPPL